MSQSIIVLGDRTSHGGSVISASPFSDTHGKGWARIGDMVSCPRCGGVFPISQGDPGLIDDGKSVAYHGCKTACGATLISSQNFTITTPLSGTPLGTKDTRVANGFGPIGADLIAGYHDQQLDKAQRFRGRFQVLDQGSGAPVSGIETRVRSTGGQYVTGLTDDEGYTPWVEREAAETLAFDIVQKSS